MITCSYLNHSIKKNVISSPTRITNHSESLIDHILCNSEFRVSASVYNVTIADRSPTFLSLSRKYMPSLCNTRNRRSTCIIYAEIRWLLQGVDFQKVFDLCDVHTQCETLIQFMCNAIKQSTRVYVHHNCERPVCPWITNTVLETLKQKNSFYRKWKRNKSNSYYREIFKYFRNSSVSMIRKSKSNTILTLLRTRAVTQKKIWEIIKEVIGKGKIQSIQPEKPSTQVANDFNYYFANIGMNLANQFLSGKPALVLPRIVENDFHLE